MSKSEKEYLKHILDEINFLLDSSEETSEERFMRDATLQRAYTRSLEIIGEAVKSLPEEFRNNYSKVDWKSMAGMRDRLIHHYFGVDYEIVWDVVKNEIPQLKTKLQEILKKLE
jgi:uncharacterized protein with HEPN domain